MPKLITDPKVTLISSTKLDSEYLKPSDRGYALERWMEMDECSTLAEDVVEFAGRSCYESWSKPNPATRANSEYIAHIIKQGHESVLEHASATFYIEGVSRSLTHELVRHRHFSFSQRSQRYVDESESAFVVPPAILDSPNKKLVSDFTEAADKALAEYESIVEALTKDGLPRKQAREAARSVLPNSVETKIVVTGNHRAWRDFLKKRLSPAADREIARLANVLLWKLRDVAPAVYADIQVPA